MPKLLEHAEVVTYGNVFDDLRLLHAEAMNVFDREFLVIRRERHARPETSLHAFINFRNCLCAGFSTRCNATSASPIRIA